MFRFPISRKKKPGGRFIVAIALLLTSVSALFILYSIILDSYSTDKLRSHNNNATRMSGYVYKAKRLPQALIIGSRKSGTRALLKFLEVNQAIHTAQREVHFFDKLKNYQLGLNWYRDQMPETDINEVTIEKSPAYFVSDGVPERVKTMNSSIKLILIVRHPVIRLISDFSQTISNKFDILSAENKNSMNSSPIYYDKDSFWAQASRDFESYVSRPDGGIDEQRHAIRIGMYSNYLEKWFAVFPRKQFHFVDGEQLITEPHVELQKVEEFLGLKSLIKSEHFVFCPKKGFYCLRASNSTDSNGSSKRRPNSEPICLSKSKGRRHVEVRTELIEKLQAFYQPYNEYLYYMTGINFDKIKV